MPLVLIYGLIDPRDGIIKYVGKTADLAFRFRQHLNDRQRNKRTNAIQSLRRQGLTIRPTVLELVDEADWQERECHWIKTLGTDALWNSTTGGDGVAMTPEVRATMSQKMAACYSAPAQRQRLSEMASNPQRIAARNAGIAEWLKTPGVGERLRVRFAQANESPEYRARRAERNRTRALDPEWRAAAAATLAIARNDPVAVAKRDAAIRKNAADPAWRAACRDGIAAKRDTPRWRETQKLGCRTRKSSKLSMEQVAAIKAKVLARGVTLTNLATEYGVSRQMIGYIARGRWWADVAPATTEK